MWYYLLLCGIPFILGYAQGRRSMAKEISAAGQTLRKLITGK